MSNVPASQGSSEVVTTGAWPATRPKVGPTTAQPIARSIPRPATLRLASPDAPQTAGSQQLIEARQLVKSYRKGAVKIPVLQEIDFSAASGQITAILGQSGSGKARFCICWPVSINPTKVRSGSTTAASTICRGAVATAIATKISESSFSSTTCCLS